MEGLRGVFAGFWDGVVVGGGGGREMDGWDVMVLVGNWEGKGGGGGGGEYEDKR